MNVLTDLQKLISTDYRSELQVDSSLEQTQNKIKSYSK